MIWLAFGWNSFSVDRLIVTFVVFGVSARCRSCAIVVLRCRMGTARLPAMMCLLGSAVDRCRCVAFLVLGVARASGRLTRR